MRNNINKYIVILSGFIWGLSGFLMELMHQSFSKRLFQSLFVLVPIFLLLIFLEIKIDKNYKDSIVIFVFYLLFFIISIILNGGEFSKIFREVLLVVVVVVVFILLSNKNYFFYFLHGIFFSLVLLMFYYIIKIDFSQVMNIHYRLGGNLLDKTSGEQGSNGIGYLGVTTFMISYFYFVQKKIRYLIVISIISLLVVIATKSRTSLLMIIFSIIIISYTLKSYKTLILISFFALSIFFWKYNELLILFRVSPIKGYSGNNNISNLTGRTYLWINGLYQFGNSPFFGNGPSAYIIVDGHKGRYHNAYIQNLVTIGILGTLPIIYLIFMAIKKAFQEKKESLMKVIFFTGLLVTITESNLLNYGSPANFIFLLSILYFMGPKINQKLYLDSYTKGSN